MPARALSGVRGARVAKNGTASSTSLAARAGLFVLFLVCSLAVFLLGPNYYGLFSTSGSNLYAGGLSAIFLIAALFFKRSERFRRYWQIAYTFFVASVVNLVLALFGGYSRAFVQYLGTWTGTNQGMALDKVYEAVLVVVPILALTKLSGADLGSLFLKRGNPNHPWGLGIGALVLLNFSTSALIFFSPIPVSATPPQPTAVATNDRASVGTWTDIYAPDPELLDPRGRAQVIGAPEERMRSQPPSTPAHIPAQGEATPRSQGVSQGQTTPAMTLIPPLPISAPAPPSELGVGRWIDVDLTAQRVTAYEGTTPVRSVAVSTGLPYTPTPVGQFRIWVKLRYDDMEGPGYYLRDVPYTMYFHAGYGLHGTYWHSNFGYPMSHGCVNLPTPEAEWLFHWAEVGTLVNVHN